MSLVSAYRERVNSGAIEFDKEQQEAIEILSVLSGRLKNWKRGQKQFLFGKPEPLPEGVFIYGKVGRGKSMIMDLFFDHAPTEIKQRIHFHQFMLNAHEKINEWRKLSNEERKKRPNFVKGVGDDPIPPIAKEIADNAHLLCFDEFQITDIADAMILGRLFESLWKYQTVIVATSNRPPEEQYKNGLNRQLIVPFLIRLNEELLIHSLDSLRDYRLARLKSEPMYFSPLGAAADEFMTRAWARLCLDAKEILQTISVDGRTILIKRTAASSARFDFNELCGDKNPMGVHDYLEIAKCFNTIFLENVPLLDKNMAFEATRFRNLIDALYEAKTKLIMTIACPIEELYQSGTQSFEFERTISRLHEMQSDDYLGMEKG